MYTYKKKKKERKEKGKKKKEKTDSIFHVCVYPRSVETSASPESRKSGTVWSLVVNSLMIGDRGAQIQPRVKSYGGVTDNIACRIKDR